MAENKKDLNSGVQALSGFSFQRNSIIYLILDKYDLLVGDNFFICVEHYDDFVFAHLDSKNKLCKVDAYQAKKATSPWSTNKKLAEILAKMTLVGKRMKDDPMPKSDDYSHNLIFLTNKKIDLICGGKIEPKYSQVIKEDNVYVLFSNLHKEIKNNIENKFPASPLELDEVENISFRYIDVANTDKSQRNQLAGMISDLFSEEVTDPSAALCVLLNLFKDVETVYNQGEDLSFLDASKRVYSSEIFKAFNIIFSKAKAYKFWRDNAANLSAALRLPVGKTRDYDTRLSDCFDYFKDLSQVEFAKIYRFVSDNNHVDDEFYSDVDCVKALYELYQKEKSSQLDVTMIAFAIIAAYVETRNIK